MSDRTPKQIHFDELEEQVNNGWKRERIAEHYGLTIAATKRLLKDAGLRIRSTRYPNYVLIKENEDDNTREIIIETNTAGVTLENIVLEDPDINEDHTEYLEAREEGVSPSINMIGEEPAIESEDELFNELESFSQEETQEVAPEPASEQVSDNW